MKSIQIKPVGVRGEEAAPGENRSLGGAVLLYNAIWFTKVRWMVILGFAGAGLSGLWAPRFFLQLGLFPPGWWALALAGILTVANLYYHVREKHLSDDASLVTVKQHLWMQIIVDLLVLTAVVYVVGSTETFICFTYLFHIVLACIFFAPVQSLCVTVLASVMFTTCTLLEATRVIPRSCMVMAERLTAQPGLDLYMMHSVSAVCVWIIVWYLVSTLSQSVRTRDIQLAEANSELIKADQEKNKKVLRTVHDLKAPFTGIQNIIQILRGKHKDSLPDDVQALLDRIHIRAQTLSERIKGILILGDLRSANRHAEDREVLGVKDLIHSVLDELKARAASRSVIIETDIGDLSVSSNRKMLFFLFSNIISNAIAYSHEGGTVSITGKAEGKEIRVAVADQGIGISEKALPHIFEEYFRSTEGAGFNQQSSGLGLAIVKETAQKLGLVLTVRSEQDKGTTFEIAIPSVF